MTGHDDRRTTSLVVLPQRSLAAVDRSLEAMTTRSIENSSMYLKIERERMRRSVSEGERPAGETRGRTLPDRLIGQIPQDCLLDSDSRPRLQ